MPLSNIGLFTLMLVAGFGIPVMAALNAAVGQKLGSPIAAVLLLCIVATVAAGALFLLLPRPDWSSFALPSLPQLFAGVLFILYIGSITYAAPKIGLGNAVFFVLFGQLVCAAAIDHFALLGAAEAPLSAKRALGLAFMAAGVYLARAEVLAPGN